MVKCIFCGKDENYFKGLNLITNEGRVDYYCSSKCRLNALKLKRVKRRVKWTEAFRERRAKGKEKATRKK